MANKRIFYAVERISFSECGANSHTSVHGAQSVGLNTRFQLESIFELSQISLYQTREALPEVEITIQKVLDGSPLCYHMATKGATSATLAGRSNIKATFGMSLYSDGQDAASGSPVSSVVCSGVYVSALNYRFPVEGNFTEDVTLVGNDKVFYSSGVINYTDSFDNTDTPVAPEGVNARQHFLFGPTSTAVPTKSLLPTEIPGITASGTNESANGIFGASVQNITVSTNLGREQLLELGRRAPYHRYISFPVQVTTDIEIISKSGDGISALEEDETNLVDQRIYLMTQDTTILDLGTKNKLSQVTVGGGNAGQNGGNQTVTYSYQNFNDLTVTQAQDPSGL